MSRWEEERASADKLRTRDEHLEAANSSKESMLKDISKELDRKGILAK